MCMGVPEPKRLNVNLAPPPPASVFAERIRQPLMGAAGEALEMTIDPDTGAPIVAVISPQGARNKLDVDDAVYQALRDSRQKLSTTEKEIKSLRASLAYLEGQALQDARDSLAQKLAQKTSTDSKIERLTTSIFVGQYGAKDEALQSLVEAKATIGAESVTAEQASKLAQSLGANVVGDITDKKASEEALNKAIRAKEAALKTQIVNAQTLQQPTTKIQREALGERTDIKRGREQLKITL